MTAGKLIELSLVTFGDVSLDIYDAIYTFLFSQ